MQLTRITFDPAQMGGQACIRGLRIPVATIVRCVANGMSTADILDLLEGDRGLPAQLALDLPAIEGIAKIVTGSIRDEGDEGLRLAHQTENQAGYREVRPLGWTGP